jgi:hypothetical protein
MAQLDLDHPASLPVVALSTFPGRLHLPVPLDPLAGLPLTNVLVLSAFNAVASVIRRKLGW